MAAPALNFSTLLRQIKKGSLSDLATVYLLHGEEGFFTDRLAEALIEHIPEADRDFNLTVLYGPQTNAASIHEACARFPMMSSRQMVVVRELQSMRATELDKLEPYLLNPSPHTVLVLIFRGEKAKGRTFLAAVRKSGAVAFESAKLKSAAEAVTAMVRDRGMAIDAKGLAMLADHVGTDLSRIDNEVNKLAVALGPGASITPEAVERYVGISKDFNNFELVEALADRNLAKAFAIVDRFTADPKNHPVPPIVATIFGFFQNLTIYLFLADKTPANAAAALGLKFASGVQRFERGSRQYNAFQTLEIISAIRLMDAQSKGYGSRQDPYALLHDLVYRILAARGQLPV